MRALLLLAGLFAACTPSFPSASEVTDLRILAISAEPPEAFADQQSQTVQAVRVRMLVADPNSSGLITADAAACAPTDSLICDPTRFVLSLPEQRAAPGEIVWDLV